MTKILPEILGNEELECFDALSATGIRALRYGKESGLDSWANDCNPEAVKMIERNAESNGVELKTSEGDANIVMRRNRFDFVDLDPFGSPIRFVESASASLGRNGFLALTATDTAPLCGSYPKVAERRYGIRSMRTDYYSEMGLRILLSSVMRIFHRFEKIFIPMFCYSRLHYFRIYGKVEKGVKRVNRQMKQFSYVSHCFGCGWRGKSLEKICPICGKKTEFSKIYLGEIQDRMFLDNLEKELQKRMFVPEEKLVNKVRNEVSFPLYYDLHYLYKKLSETPRKMDETIKDIKNKGFKVSRTHFCPTALRTNASFKEMKELI